MWYKIKKIYQWTNQVRPNETKIVHFPLESDVLDHWPNNVSMTEYQTKSFTTLASWKKVIYSTDWWWLLSASNFVSTYLSTHKYTVRVWVNPTKNSLARRDHFKIVKNKSAWRDWIEAGVCTRETQGYGWYEQVYYVRWSTNWLVGSTSYNWWHHIVAVYDNWTLKVYINWSLYQTVSTYTISDWYLLLPSWDNDNDWLHWYMSEFFIDSKLWTAAEALSDYNNTKSLYWL
jgi:hypothetical protein